jgi:hypothetical protein
MSDNKDFDFKDAFFELGCPGNEGKCFAITKRAFDEEFGQDLHRFPVPAYEHAIFRCHKTDNFIVCRPDNDGYSFFADLERIR